MEEDRNLFYRLWITITAFVAVLFLGATHVGSHGVSDEENEDKK
jgi:hypothetical protein